MKKLFKFKKKTTFGMRGGKVLQPSYVNNLSCLKENHILFERTMNTHTRTHFNYKWIVETMKIKCSTGPEPKAF